MNGILAGRIIFHFLRSESVLWNRKGKKEQRTMERDQIIENMQNRFHALANAFSEFEKTTGKKIHNLRYDAEGLSFFITCENDQNDGGR